MLQSLKFDGNKLLFFFDVCVYESRIWSFNGNFEVFMGYITPAFYPALI